MTYTWPSPEQFESLNALAGDDRPITMLNLLRYRDQADYSAHPDETPCTGRAAYGRYADKALECVSACGGRLVFAAPAGLTAIGPADERWDDVLLVEYPSVRAFVDMASSERYQGFAYHREAALMDSRLIMLTAGELAYLG